MRTVTYDYVLQRACELTGRVFSTLTTEESNFFRTFISMSLRSAWECFDWPEQTVYEQQYFAANYDPAQLYSAGMVVYFKTEQKYYQYVGSINSGNPPTTGGPGGTLNAQYWANAEPDYGNNDGNWDATTTYTIGQIVLYPDTQRHYQLYATAPAGTVPTNSVYWGVLNKFLRNISQTNNPDGTTRAVPIGETFSVWPGDPRVSWRQQEATYTFTDDGVLVGDQLPYVWLEFRKTPPLGTWRGVLHLPGHVRARQVRAHCTVRPRVPRLVLHAPNEDGDSMPALPRRAARTGAVGTRRPLRPTGPQ